MAGGVAVKVHAENSMRTAADASCAVEVPVAVGECVKPIGSAMCTMQEHDEDTLDLAVQAVEQGLEIRS